MGRCTGLPQNDHHRAIGMLEAAMTVNDVAVSFGVYHATVWKLTQRFRTTGAVKDRPISGSPEPLTPREEHYIRIRAGRDHFLPATGIVDRVQRATGFRISAQTVRNKLKACRLQSRGPHNGMEVTVHHKRKRQAWSNQHMRRKCRTVFFRMKLGSS
jgi:transposase